MDPRKIDNTVEKNEQQQSSVAAMRAKFSGKAEAIVDNSQRNNTSAEIAGLKNNSIVSKYKTLSTEADPASSSEAKFVGRLEDRAAFLDPAKNLQRQNTLSELEGLAKGNVANKRQLLLDALLAKSRAATKVMKQNEVSRSAKKVLCNPAELALFTQHQASHIDKINELCKKDLETFADTDQFKTIGDEKFLKLSNIYRSYQVCLERDVILQIAERIKKRERILSSQPYLVADNSLFKSESDPKSVKVNELITPAAKLAVDSLNYYQDFFKNLNDIEKFWDCAGTDIRLLEIQVLCAAQTYGDLPLLLDVLLETPGAMERFAKETKALATGDRELGFMNNYIACGDGLNEEKHPWVCEGKKRINTNKTISFEDVMAGKVIAPDIIDDVQSRMAEDSAMKAAQDANSAFSQDAGSRATVRLPAGAFKLLL